MESYGAACIYVVGSGTAMNMDDNIRVRFRALKTALKPEAFTPTTTSVYVVLCSSEYASLTRAPSSRI